MRSPGELQTEQPEPSPLMSWWVLLPQTPPTCRALPRDLSGHHRPAKGTAGGWGLDPRWVLMSRVDVSRRGDGGTSGDCQSPLRTRLGGTGEILGQQALLQSLCVKHKAYHSALERAGLYPLRGRVGGSLLHWQGLWSPRGMHLLPCPHQAEASVSPSLPRGPIPLPRGQHGINIIDGTQWIG